MPVAGFKFRKSSRLVAGLAVAASAALGIGLGGGAADAAPPAPLPYFSGTGDSFGTFGNHDYCRGSVHVGLTSPKRGVVRVNLTSHGFSGQGPGWTRNPRCGMLFIVKDAFVHETFIRASFGQRPGESISRDIRTGSGLVHLDVGTYATGTAVRTPMSYGMGAFTVVP